MRKAMLVLSILLITLPLTGCWDRKEVNELGLVMAKAIDLTANGEIRVSVQVAKPSAVGGSQHTSTGDSNSYFVVSATGRTVGEADARLQQRLPRQLYLPHLRVILVGESMATSGMDKILDHFGRNPPNRLRSAILVAKGSDALAFLNTSSPLESISGESIRKLERQLIGTNTTLMDFLIEAASEGTDEFTSAISLQSESAVGQSGDQKQDKPYFTFQNEAIFKDLKLVGYLNTPESIAMQWMNERLHHVTITTTVPGAKGTISVELSHPRRRARTFVRGSDVMVQYHLSGTALLIENATGMDADDPETMALFQSALNKHITSTAQACLSTLTKQLDADAVGIGLMIYHQHPVDWERLKKDWHKQLPNVRYNVTSEVKLMENGKSGPPLYTKQQRGISKRGTVPQQVGGGNE